MSVSELHARMQRLDLVGSVSATLQREATRLARATEADVLVDADGMTVALRGKAAWEREKGTPGCPPDAALARLVAAERKGVADAIAAAIAATMQEA